MKERWWSEGIRFECQGSGQCCTSHGESGYVYVMRSDRKRLAQHLGLSARDFLRQYCRKVFGRWALVDRVDTEDCIFLKGKRCSAYAARPTQCRTWPFWPVHMSPKAWKKDVASYCPGVGKGRLYSEEEIVKILNEQLRNEYEPS